MGFASGAGALCALLVHIVLRRFKIRRRSATITAVLFPPAVMAYLLCFVICSAILSAPFGTPDLLFGDINEPLPNGFHLYAIDKMPEDGLIQRRGDALGQVGWVSELQVVGPYVAGEYGYHYFPRTETQATRNFFLFDTRTTTTRDFATEAELAGTLNVPLRLTATPYFHAPTSLPHHFLDAALWLVAFVPPVAAGLWLIWRFFGLIRSRNSDPMLLVSGSLT
jgi:hypothetical protein